jgi:ARG and Rhodanese-Phosphatase-superfamily-associated Protein domain
MHIFSLAAAGLAVLSFAAAAPRSALADTETRISGPHTHENLSVYFIHGASAEGPVPLTLQEALDKGSVRILETGNVNELKVENTGDEDIFIQSGDIVKGGRQDRVLRMSFVLPPKSGAVPLAAFCVEAGRWSARGTENATTFLSAAEAMPSREAKLAMRAPRDTAALPPTSAGQSAAASPQRLAGGDAVYLRQQEVWASVAATQEKLSEQVGAAVASPRSQTSLQLSLENEKLKEARGGYVDALEKPGTETDDIVGYVIAVNGNVASADVYPSNALFRKMWPKQLAAAVTEAIGAKGGKPAEAPSVESVNRFLVTAEGGRAQEEVVNDLSRQEVRDADKALFVEARRGDGAWVHRNYLAK